MVTSSYLPLAGAGLGRTGATGHCRGAGRLARPVLACVTTPVCPWCKASGRTAVRSECSATRELYLGSALEPLTHRVQPAGAGAGALQPPSGPRIAVAGQAGGYPPGRIEFTPDGDIEISGGPPQARDLVANGRDLADSGPVSRAPGVDGNEPVPAGGSSHRPAARMHPSHPAGGPG